jgi:hypothetical protein
MRHIEEAIKRGWSPKQLKRKKAGKKVYENGTTMNESDNRKARVLIDYIIDSLDTSGAIDKICKAADKGDVDIHTFIDEYGEDILARIERAMVEQWDLNF